MLNYSTQIKKGMCSKTYTVTAYFVCPQFNYLSQFKLYKK